MNTVINNEAEIVFTNEELKEYQKLLEEQKFQNEWEALEFKFNYVVEFTKKKRKEKETERLNKMTQEEIKKEKEEKRQERIARTRAFNQVAAEWEGDDSFFY